MTLITTKDAIFSALPAAIGSSSSFLADVVNLINRSPNLLAEINTLDAFVLPGGKTATINTQTGENNGGSTYYHSPTINIGALASYNDAVVYCGSGSLTAGPGQNVTAAGAFVGILAHEISHWGDAALAPIYAAQTQLGSYTLEQAVATEFASEGKAATNQFLTKSQIEGTEAKTAAPSGMANGAVLFDIGVGTAQDTVLLQHEQAIAGSSTFLGQSVSYLASSFWNVAVDSGTYLSTMWGGYGTAGAVNDLGLDETSITGYQISETEAGTLQGCTIDTAGLVYAVTCPVIGHETALVTSATTGALAASISSAVTASGLTETIAASGFTFSTAASTTLTMTGNSNVLVLGAGASDTVTLAGNGDELFGSTTAATALKLSLGGTGEYVALTSGSASVSGGNASATVFGGSGTLAYAGGGGAIVLGSGAASVSGGAAGTIQTVFGGSGHLVYTGQAEFADVVAGTGSVTIHAGSGGGWYCGGTAGGNVITGVAGNTLLQGGGNGDLLTGDGTGGDWLEAGTGNETLLGGNSSGLSTLYAGSGADSLTDGRGGSAVSLGSGSASVTGGGGVDQITGGTGLADLFTAGTGGQLDIHGFRVGTDHLHTGGQTLVSTSYTAGGGTLFSLSSGATILLADVAHAGAVFV